MNEKMSGKGKSPTDRHVLRRTIYEDFSKGEILESLRRDFKELE